MFGCVKRTCYISGVIEMRLTAKIIKAQG